MTPEERLELRFAIGQYLWSRIADANDLQCTVWADGILNLVDQAITGLSIPDYLLDELTKEGDVDSSSIEA